MAQVVGYFEDGVLYSEGPFVICNPLGNGWRIEAQYPNVKHPCLPDTSIYRVLRERFKFSGKTDDRDLITKLCDQLNFMVKNGEIALVEGRYWAYGQFKTVFVEG